MDIFKQKLQTNFLNRLFISNFLFLYWLVSTFLIFIAFHFRWFVCLFIAPMMNSFMHVYFYSDIHCLNNVIAVSYESYLFNPLLFNTQSIMFICFCLYFTGDVFLKWMILLTWCDLLLCELMFYWTVCIVLCKALENIFGSAIIILNRFLTSQWQSIIVKHHSHISRVRVKYVVSF